jgi:hypothetical protein
MTVHGSDSTSSLTIIQWLVSNKDICDLFIFICLQLSEILEWQVVCTKVREGDKRIVRLKEGHVSGHHVVIVDDLVQSGGTLIECQVNYQFLTHKRCLLFQKKIVYV